MPVFEGIYYPSAKSYVESEGLSYTGVFSVRKRDNCTWEEAVQTYIEYLKRKTQLGLDERYTVGDKTNLTFNDACSEARISAKTVRELHSVSGKFYQEIFDKAFARYTESSENAVFYSVGELSGLSFTRACKEAGTKVARLNKLMKEFSLTMQEAFDYVYEDRMANGPYRPRGEIEYKTISFAPCNGIDSFKVECKICGRVLRITRKERISFKHSISFCESHVFISEGAADCVDMYVVGDKEIKGISAACVEAHVSMRKLKALNISTGKSFQDLLTEAYERYDSTKDDTVYYVGETACYSKSDCAKAIGIGKESFYAMCNRNNGDVPKTIEHYRRVGVRTAAVASNSGKIGLSNVRFAYVGRNKLKYYRATCSQCGSILILSQYEVMNFKHSNNQCAKYKVGCLT